MADHERRIQRIEQTLQPDSPGQKEAARRRRISRRQAFAFCLAESRGLSDEVFQRCFPNVWRWASVRPENAGAEVDLSQLESLPEIFPMHGTTNEDAPL